MRFTILSLLCLLYSMGGHAAGNWTKTESGCELWSEHLTDGLIVTWSGACTEGRASGSGTATWEWDEQGMRMKERYEGDVDSGRIQRGKFTYENGDRYEGGFDDSKKQGEGVYIASNGDRYQGGFRDDLLNGHGTLAWSDGRRYEGEFKDGKISGFGVFTWADTRQFEGNFIADFPHGLGRCRNLDGQWGACEFNNGEFLGWR